MRFILCSAVLLVLLPPELRLSRGLTAYRPLYMKGLSGAKYDSDSRFNRQVGDRRDEISCPTGNSPWCCLTRLPV